VALAQDFSYNLTSFSQNQIEIDLFFSDPLYVSTDSLISDEVVVRLEKSFFGTSMSWARDLRWSYNNTESRDDYYELKKAIPPLLATEQEEKFVAAVGAVTRTALLGTFVLPLLLQIVIKAAMSRVWSLCNTL